jgi:hypothetical protein
VNALLVPVCPLPSFAVIVYPEPAAADTVMELDVQTPLDQPVVPVLVGLMDDPVPEMDRPTELE